MKFKFDISEYENTNSNINNREDVFTKDNLNILYELHKKSKTRIKTCCIIGIISILVINISIKGNISFIFTFLALAGLFVFAFMPHTKFKAKYKEMFVQTALEEIFENVNYQANSGISKDTIKNTGMMEMGNMYHSNDYIEADYNGVHFKQSDICIENSTGDGGDSETYFRGRWMIFDFNKEFKANVQVVQNEFQHTKRRRFFVKNEEKYKKVEMEDVSFNSSFTVFAQNEHDAFYILTPQMMERIKRVANNSGGYIILCFINNTLHVGVHTNRDSFEPDIIEEIDPEVERQKIINDISLITTFVNELSLDTKLFKD